MRTGSIAGAAGELGVTPGAVSKQLAQLESELGSPLFDRRHRLVPTPLALELADGIQAGINQIRRAWNEVTDWADGRVITIMANASLSMHWLVPRLVGAQEAIDGHPIRVTSLHTTDDWRNVPFDVAILRHNQTPAAWRSVSLGRERITILAAPSKAAHLPPGDPGVLVNERLFMAETRGGELERWLQKAGVVPATPPQKLPHFYIAVEACLAGRGFIAGPVSSLSDLIETGRLVAPFPDIEIEGPELTGVYNPSTCNPRTAEKLLRWLSEQLSDRTASGNSR